jgi:hypothetical protein
MRFDQGGDVLPKRRISAARLIQVSFTPGRISDLDGIQKDGTFAHGALLFSSATPGV